MKSRNAKRIILGCGSVALVLFLAPLIVGYFQIGDRDGPAFYPEAVHTSLYIIGHEAATDIKPRMSLTWVLYERPIFWGLPRRPKSEAERRTCIQRATERTGADSPVVEWLLEEEARIKNGQQVSVGDP